MDRRQSGRCTTQNWARAALAWPRKRGQSRVSAAILARARLHFGPRAIHVAPFALVPIKAPQGSSVEADPEF